MHDAWLFWLILGVSAAFFLGFPLLLFITCLFEKMPLRQYEKIASGHEANDSPQAKTMNESAAALGLFCAGTFQQRRGSKLYQALQTLWLSADGKTLVSVGGGKVGGMVFKTARFRSQTPTAIIETVNEYGTPDLSGLIDRDVILDGSFEALYALHTHRRCSAESELIPYNTTDALGSQEQSLQRIYQRAAEKGWMRVTDHQGDVFRYTFKAALYQSTIGWYGQLTKALRKQREEKRRSPDNAIFP